MMISINKDRLVEEFFELVQVDSETGHETDIANVLTKNLQNLVWM